MRGIRQGLPTPTPPWPDASPARPERRLPQFLWTGAFAQLNACERGPRLAVPGTATPRAPCRKPWAKRLGQAVSMSHFYESLVLYQAALIKTHRDGFPQSFGPRISARSAWRGGVGHREPRAPSTSIGPPETPSPHDLGKPPFRSRGRTGSGLPCGVGKP